MAERRKNKKKKEVDIKIDDKPSKEEYAVAKYLKQSLPEKKTTLLGHKVEYFIASKAVDCLVDSHWAKDNKKGDLNFSNRDVAVDFMARLLEHKFFHRAKKIVVQKEPKKKKKETEEAAQESGKEKDTKKSDKSSKSESEKQSKSENEKTSKTDVDKTSKNEEEKSSKTEGEKTDEKETKKESGEVVEKKKEKKKIKLDMHLEQLFIDSNEPYVWIYDPIPLKTWITGTLMVVAAVLLCLFPLWPQTIRHYIYYLSVAAAFFLVFIIGLAVLRIVVFVLVWIVTFGKHHLWLLPNLTEDVGFFESFWPLYHYEYKGFKPKDKKESGSKQEDELLESKDSPEKSKTEKEHEDSPEKVTEEKELETPDTESCEKESENQDQSQSESEEKSESEAHKTDNGFEFLEADEVSDSADEEEDRKTK